MSTQLEAGTPVDNVAVDTRMSIIKEVSAKWITSAFDYIRSHPNIIINGFVKAGILDSSSGQAESSSSHAASTVVESDPFASDSDY